MCMAEFQKAYIHSEKIVKDKKSLYYPEITL